MNAPLALPKEAAALNDLAWWAAERERAGADWRTLLLNVVRALGLVAPCDVCEREPCATPSFCQLCREDDAARKSCAPAMQKRPRPPDATIEAIKQNVREHGLAALKERATLDRLAICDNAARAEIDRWLTRIKAAAA